MTGTCTHHTLQQNLTCTHVIRFYNYHAHKIYILPSEKLQPNLSSAILQFFGMKTIGEKNLRFVNVILIHYMIYCILKSVFLIICYYFREMRLNKSTGMKFAQKVPIQTPYCAQTQQNFIQQMYKQK